MSYLSQEQERALHQVAVSLGWDKRSEDYLRLLAWAAFHYYAMRLTAPWERSLSSG